jgi:hypothetical protein
MEQQPLVSLDTQLGPWAGYLNAYTTLIKERGYAPVSVQTQVQLITKFCEWSEGGTPKSMHWTRSSWSDSCGVTRVQILHAVATLPRCSGFSRCFANKGLPSGRRNRLCLLKDNSPRILDDTC